MFSAFFRYRACTTTRYGCAMYPSDSYRELSRVVHGGAYGSLPQNSFIVIGLFLKVFCGIPPTHIKIEAIAIKIGGRTTNKNGGDDQILPTNSFIAN
jgi:hypothetical protein